jgi:hypothetical protein
MSANPLSKRLADAQEDVSHRVYESCPMCGGRDIMPPRTITRYRFDYRGDAVPDPNGEWARWSEIAHGSRRAG